MTVPNEPVIGQAVIVSLRVSDQLSPAQHERIGRLATRLEAALAAVSDGEFGGEDTLGSYCVLYCYGADADEVFAAISPLIHEFGPEPRSWAIKRFGAASDLDARREWVDLSPA